MRKSEAVESHWSVLIDAFNTSGRAFFESVEARVRERQVPGATFERVAFRESGVLSDTREYLRVKRGDLIFDVGAAPFGTGFFFSWWLVRSGSRYPWLYLVGYASALLLAAAALAQAVGAVLGFVLAFFLTTFGLGLLAKRGAFGPEEHVAEAPLIGGLYVRLFNPATYHALDSVAMYRESVRRAVNEAVDAALTTQGLKALSPEQRALAGGPLSGGAGGRAANPS